MQTGRQRRTPAQPKANREFIAQDGLLGIILLILFEQGVGSGLAHNYALTNRPAVAHELKTGTLPDGRVSAPIVDNDPETISYKALVKVQTNSAKQVKA